MIRRFTRQGTILPLALVAAALAGAGAGTATYAALDRGGTSAERETAVSAQPAAQTQSPISVSDIYRRTSAGVVEITVSTSAASNSPFPFGGSGSQAQGSGFVYDEQGHVVTNEHVVDGASSITVRFANGATYKARVVGTDPSTDLAVLKVDAPKSVLEPLQLGDSSNVRVGDGVVAIGSPFGLENSVTSGIVSGLHRDITAPNDFAISDSIQTDAAINHGNSGGVLLDLQGRVIGVTAQIKSESGGSDGVGFAIPSNTVRSVVSQLVSSGKIAHAYLGVSIQTIPADAARALGVPQGVEVAQVRAGTPAAGAGLKGATGTRTVNAQTYPTGGDVITRVNGKRVTTDDELRSLVDAERPGARLTLTYVRNGVQKVVTVKLATRPS